DSSEQQLYEDAQRYLRSSNFDLGVRVLQLLESRYPFGRYAEQAQLEIIYAHYQNFEHEAAVESANRFIRLHPQHPSVDYAYYMRGLAAYDEDKGLLDNFLPTDFTKRDPGGARQSFTDFAQLLARYPSSPYAPDAKARMVHLRNLLARYEINVANYYFKRGAYQAAVNRGRYVVENFQQTPAVADGLAVMVQAYLLLDMDDLAQDSLTVLAANYPEHPSIGSNGEFRSSFNHSGAERNWTSWLSLGFLDKGAPTEFDNRPPRD
ncbi:MAG: outer membrane protein assembly factor BamD, partial [Halieaceae bacterium]